MSQIHWPTFYHAGHSSSSTASPNVYNRWVGVVSALPAAGTLLPARHACMGLTPEKCSSARPGRCLGISHVHGVSSMCSRHRQEWPEQAQADPHPRWLQAACTLLAAGLSLSALLGGPLDARAAPAEEPPSAEMIQEERSRVEYSMQLADNVRKAVLLQK